MRALVIDASVAIKWVIQEEGTPEALSLRQFRLSAPDLLVPECANILWKKVRRRELNEAEAIIAARLLEQSGVELLPMQRLLEPAIRLSLSLDHPAYDCLYLVLAENTGRDFVTADRKLCARARAHGVPARVLMLSEALT